MPILRLGRTRLYLVILLLATGCAKKAATPAFDPTSLPTKASRRVTLREVQPILTAKCTACHNPGGMDEGVPVGGLVLLNGSAASNLVNVPSLESKLVRVAPGDLAR